MVTHNNYVVLRMESVTAMIVNLQVSSANQSEYFSHHVTSLAQTSSLNNARLTQTQIISAIIR